METETKYVKTVSMCFHVHNAQSQLELNIFLNGQWLAASPKPVYLRVTIDHTVTYTYHLTNVAEKKIKSRNGLLNKLWGFTWEVSRQMLHSLGLVLCHSVVKYCFLV